MSSGGHILTVMLVEAVGVGSGLIPKPLLLASPLCVSFPPADSPT